MINNDFLKKFRYAFNFDDQQMMDIFAAANHAADRAFVCNLLKSESDEEYLECSDRLLGLFLDGFISLKRGKKEEENGEKKSAYTNMNNNVILKKMRVALELKEADLLEILSLADFQMTKSELTALFRKEGHRNYKECGDQFLRNFLKGLAEKTKEQ